MRVQRIIHPVGQGAFYSEQLISDSGKKFTVVYDCGCGMKDQIPQEVESIIEEWLKDIDQIDILFLSHFHNDHINGFDLLRNKAKVVVLPYISNTIKTAINAHIKEIKNPYKAIDKNLNNTSMLMFSSPMSLDKCNGSKESNSPSCLYTGDIKLADNKINQLISTRLGKYNIGTLQVPHHGSSYSWRRFNSQTSVSNTTSHTVYFCSHGLHNFYNHPHKAVLYDFINSSHLLYGINENPTTKMVQVFYV